MGYTHYFTQSRDYKPDEWAELCEDFRALFAYFENVAEIKLANGMSDMGTGPEITADYISFNGAGDDGCETFMVERKREADEWTGKKGFWFCKTNRQPYDLAVTAALCYLSTIAETHHVESDGSGANYVQGLEAARQALPRHANRLDIPMGVMQADRWCGPWPSIESKSYDFRFCVDGRAYITRLKDGATYAFRSHREAAEWAQTHRENDRRGMASGEKLLFRAFGSFDAKRRQAIARQQSAVLGYMVEMGAMFEPDRAAMKPPAYVRPGQLPLMAEEAPRFYSFADLLAAVPETA